MRAENEHPDAAASGDASVRAMASLVACLAAMNIADQPVPAAQPLVVPHPIPPPARMRRPLAQRRLAAPFLAVVLVLMATPSLAWREPSLWPPQSLSRW